MTCNVIASHVYSLLIACIGFIEKIDVGSRGYSMPRRDNPLPVPPVLLHRYASHLTISHRFARDEASSVSLHLQDVIAISASSKEATLVRIKYSTPLLLALGIKSRLHLGENG